MSFKVDLYRKYKARLEELTNETSQRALRERVGLENCLDGLWAGMSEEDREETRAD